MIAMFRSSTSAAVRCRSLRQNMTMVQPFPRRDVTPGGDEGRDDDKERKIGRQTGTETDK